MPRAYANLQELSTALRRHVDVDAIFTSINTRLIIQTGVNLKRVKPEQNDDPQVIDAVQRALHRMGIELGGGSD
jgi:hypothetical protein